MNVHNMMEDAVKHCLREMINQNQLADSDENLLSDIMAIALNNLPPKYVATSKGEMFTKTQLRLQVDSDVYRELSHAIEKVQSTPKRSLFINKENE